MLSKRKQELRKWQRCCATNRAEGEVGRQKDVSTVVGHSRTGSTMSSARQRTIKVATATRFRGCVQGTDKVDVQVDKDPRLEKLNAVTNRLVGNGRAQKIFTEVLIGYVATRFIVDTGATVSLLSKQLQELGCKISSECNVSGVAELLEGRNFKHWMFSGRGDLQRQQGLRQGATLSCCRTSPQSP